MRYWSFFRLVERGGASVTPRAGRWHLLAPASVIAVAALVRLWQVDLAQFQDDQARLLASAARLLDTHQIPGTTGLNFTIGVRHPPLTTFLLAGGLLFSRNAAWASAYTALFDIAAAFLVYLTGKRMGGTVAGTAAGLLYALSPSAIFYSRTVWNPDFVPFFSAVALLGMVAAWQSKNSWPLAAALVAVLFATQLHLAAASLIPLWVAVAIACIFKYGRSPLPLAVGGIVGVLPLVPYLWLQVNSGWRDLAAVIDYVHGPKHVDWLAPEAASKLLGGEIYHQLLLPQGTSWPSLGIEPVGWMIIALVVLGLLLAFWKRSGGHLILCGAVLVPVIFSLKREGYVEPYYLLEMLPAAFVAAGFAIATTPLPLAMALLAVPLAWQGNQYLLFIGSLAAHGEGTNFNMPLRYAQQAASYALAHTNPGETLYVADHGDNIATFGYLIGHRLKVKQVDSRFSLLFPQHAATYVAEDDGGYAYHFLLDHYGPPMTTINMSSGATAFGIFRLPEKAAETFDASHSLRPLHIDVAHALEIDGFSAPRFAAGTPSPIAIEWRVVNNLNTLPPEVNQFGHLLDASGHTWSTNPDFRGYRRAFWQPGDVILSWFVLAPPASTPRGGYWFETGFIGSYSFERLPLYGTSGPMGSVLRLGPVKVEGVAPAPPANIRPLATFDGGAIALLRVTCAGGSIQADWYTARKPDGAYTIFWHVLDSQGKLLAQHDGPPLGGTYPTSMWDAGELVKDKVELPTASVKGALAVGMYTAPDLKRLPVFDAENHPLGDHFVLPACTS